MGHAKRDMGKDRGGKRAHVREESELYISKTTNRESRGREHIKQTRTRNTHAEKAANVKGEWGEALFQSPAWP